MGNTGRKPSIKEAIANETKIGFMQLSYGPAGGGNTQSQPWRWNGKDWEKVTDKVYNAWLVTQEYTKLDQTLTGKISIGPLGESKGPDLSSLRWPKDSINTGTDYIFFQFGRYKPPFAKDVQYLREGLEDLLLTNPGSEEVYKKVKGKATNAAGRGMYNASNTFLEPTQDNIMLPMPQDLSTEVNQQWQGKQFTAAGRAAVAGLAAGNFSYASLVVADIAGNATALQTALNTTVLNSIPGVGGNLEFNDVSGSTRGIVINPNAELLYDSPEMREVGMIFKMVPKNYEESVEINNIVRAFRKHSMPRWGGLTDEGKTGDVTLTSGEKTVSGGKVGKDASGFNMGDMNNWIQVPDLCKFTFMTGSHANEHVIQYKPCAISGVEVNYTSDGTWSSYNNPDQKGFKGSPPVAVELRLNFMETKLIFADEVEIGF